MKTASDNGELNGLLEQLQAISVEARMVFGNLNVSQLNWKPTAERWSIGECFDHLIVTNRTYFAPLQKIINGEKSSLWERISPLSGFFGKMLLKAVKPDSGRKFKAPKAFRPTSSDVDAQIIENFIAHQQEVISLMSATKDLDLRRVKIKSSISGFVTYSLWDAYNVLVIHEKRHFLQATRVLESADFPRAEQAA